MTTAASRTDRRTAWRILIVDDHPMMRKGLANLIETEPDLAVCGEAASARAGLAAIRKSGPHLVIVDLALENSDGMDLLKEMKLHHPGIPALVISMHDEELYAERVLRAGARGFVAKHEMGETVLTAIRQLLAGERYMSVRTRARFAEQFLDGRPARGESSLGALSNRELQVLRLIGAGRGSRDIAQALNLSVKTVESHREHIKRKLKLGSGPALVRLATEFVRSAQ